MDHCYSLIEVARGAILAGRNTEAFGVIAKARGLTEGIKDDSDRCLALIEIETALALVGVSYEVMQVHRVAQALMEKLSKDDERHFWRIAIFKDVNWGLGESRRYFAAAIRSTSGQIPEEAAIRTIQTYQHDWLRGQALLGIVRLQLVQQSQTAAEATVKQIEGSEQHRDEGLGLIAESFAGIGQTTKALQIARDIQDDSRSAQRILGIAAIMAQNGDRRAARNIATSLDYPRTDDRFVNAFGGAVNQFRFNDPSTWAADFDGRFAFTTRGSQFQQERGTDLAAAAMRCRVALERQVPCDKRYRGGDPRKMAKAQAVGGDSRSVLVRMKALEESEEVEILLGLAEGFVEFRDENDRVKCASAAPLTAAEQMQLWTDLLADPPRAWPAAVRLQSAGDATLQYLRQRIRPASPIPADELARLVAGLDSPVFATRELARRRLTVVADSNETAIRALPRTIMSLEGRKGLDRILNSLAPASVPTADETRRLERAVSVVERIGTPEAKRLLEEWAKGVPTAWLTRDAKAALDRLDR